MGAAGSGCPGLDLAVEGGGGAGDTERQIDRAPLAGHRTLRAVDAAGERGRLAFEGQAAVDRDRLVGAGLLDRERYRIGPLAGAGGPVVVGNHAV